MKRAAIEEWRVKVSIADLMVQGTTSDAGKTVAMATNLESCQRLPAQYDTVIVEGTGSPEGHGQTRGDTFFLDSHTVN